MCFAPQRRTLFQPLNFQKCAERGTLCTFWLGNVLRTTTAYTFSTSQLPKVRWTWYALYILTWKCASATTAYTFSTSQLPKVRWTWYALYILTWKCASRHNGVHFFDSSTWKVVRNCQFLILLTWKCASRHNGVHLFDISTSKNGPYVSCFVHFDLEMCFAPQRRTLFQPLNFQKCAERVRFIHFDLEIASRHNGVHFFNLSTSKSALNVVRFVHFDLEMCFAPQRRTLLQPLNFQKCAERGTLCTFWLGNVLRATMACNFSTSQLPKVGLYVWCFVHFDFVPQQRTLFQPLNFQKCAEMRWTWYALYILTWKCASRHNGVHIFDSSTWKVVRNCKFLILLTWKCA